MKTNREKVMTLRIHLLESYEIVSEKTKVCQILFEGHAEGRFFQGDILPGAVDTQMIRPDGGGTLNARYTLRGKDASGSSCMLFVENSAKLGSSVTTPRIVTDSKMLSWMNDAAFCGHMEMSEGDLIIEITKEN